MSVPRESPLSGRSYALGLGVVVVVAVLVILAIGWLGRGRNDTEGDRSTRVAICGHAFWIGPDAVEPQSLTPRGTQVWIEPIDSDNSLVTLRLSANCRRGARLTLPRRVVPLREVRTHDGSVVGGTFRVSGRLVILTVTPRSKPPYVIRFRW